VLIDEHSIERDAAQDSQITEVVDRRRREVDDPLQEAAIDDDAEVSAPGLLLRQRQTPFASAGSSCG
jgi:hypothetical protein